MHREVQVLFWLLGAIDGHAKNFSIFLLPGGSFHLTPVYDVMSAHPLVAKRQLESKNLKMAMALGGKNRHYEWSRILHRHWLSTAQACRFPVGEMRTIINNLLERVDEVIDQVAGDLPASFPGDVAAPVFDGMRSTRERLARSQLP